MRRYARQLQILIFRCIPKKPLKILQYPLSGSQFLTHSPICWSKCTYRKAHRACQRACHKGNVYDRAIWKLLLTIFPPLHSYIGLSFFFSSFDFSDQQVWVNGYFLPGLSNQSRVIGSNAVWSLFLRLLSRPFAVYTVLQDGIYFLGSFLDALVQMDSGMILDFLSGLSILVLYVFGGDGYTLWHFSNWVYFHPLLSRGISLIFNLSIRSLFLAWKYFHVRIWAYFCSFYYFHVF